MKKVISFCLTLLFSFAFLTTTEVFGGCGGCIIDVLDDGPGSSTPTVYLNIGDTHYGSIDSPGEINKYSILVPNGTCYRIKTSKIYYLTSTNLGATLDTNLSNDEKYSYRANEYQVDFKRVSDGHNSLEIYSDSTSSSIQTGDYRLDVESCDITYVYDTGITVQIMAKTNYITNPIVLNTCSNPGFKIYIELPEDGIYDPNKDIGTSYYLDNCSNKLLSSEFISSDTPNQTSYFENLTFLKYDRVFTSSEISLIQTNANEFDSFVYENEVSYYKGAVKKVTSTNIEFYQHQNSDAFSSVNFTNSTTLYRMNIFLNTKNTKILLTESSGVPTVGGDTSTLKYGRYIIADKKTDYYTPLSYYTHISLGSANANVYTSEYQSIEDLPYDSDRYIDNIIIIMPRFDQYSLS